jgi:hypothetical protein
VTGGPWIPDDLPAQRTLDAYLELLRTERPEPGRALARRTVRTARWQRSVRAPLRVVGLLAGALFDGVTKLVGSLGREANP